MRSRAREAERQFADALRSGTPCDRVRTDYTRLMDEMKARRGRNALLAGLVFWAAAILLSLASAVV